MTGVLEIAKTPACIKASHASVMSLLADMVRS